MKIFGLTGGIGSGKTTVSDHFKSFNVPVIDTDVISRQVVEPGSPCLNKIASHFDENILLENGELNRAALRKIVFENHEEKNWLEQLLHPAIREETRKQLTLLTAPYAILSSPLLIGSPDEDLTDAIIVVDIPEDQQVERVVKRDSSDAALTQKIIDSQLSRKARLQKATYIVDNSGSLEDTLKQVEKLHKTLLSKSL